MSATDEQLAAWFERAREDVGTVGAGVDLQLTDEERLWLEPAGARAAPDVPDFLVAGPPRATAEMSRGVGQPWVDHGDVNHGGEEAFVGLARSLLEMHRATQEARGVYAFTTRTMEALSTVYAGTGAGGGVIYNMPPLMRAANAAGADLVNRRYGPQHGRLKHPKFGLVFRLERDPVDDLSTLAPSTLAFASVWREDVEEQVPDLDLWLAYLDPAAAEWWRLLAGAPAFKRLAGAVLDFTPTREEIVASSGHEADAWRHLEALIDRATSLGTALVQEQLG